MSQLYLLVSCIMPTASRQHFIPLSIQYFLRQDYPAKELIIIDDGNDPIGHLIPICNNIHYVRLPTHGNKIGTKRNIACEIAKGFFIVHWDDDDWYAADWISRQVNILQHGTDICGLNKLFFYDADKHKSWRYEYPTHAKPWVAGATMAYKSSLWKRYPFQDIQVGEDNDFVWNSGGKVACSNYLHGFVSILHPGNTSPKHTTDTRWRPYPADEVAMILGLDRNHYKRQSEL